MQDVVCGSVAGKRKPRAWTAATEVVAAVFVVALSLILPSATGAAPPAGLLDCHGFSPIQEPAANIVCADIRPAPGDHTFTGDNGHYIGHDEPLIEFFSNKPGSGYSARYEMQIPRDPAQPPNGSPSGPVWHFQLHPALWTSMTLCDDESYPESGRDCPPRSDSNIQVPFSETHVGAALLEVQFLPPGGVPITQGGTSCDVEKWCVGMAIFSLQSNLEFSELNLNCVQPANFAFITHSGQPSAPPGPDTATPATFQPTADALKLSNGDDFTLTLRDTAHGIEAVIRNRTTGESGSMKASAANGFRHILWDPENSTCEGEPYSFHAMYASSPPVKNGVPKAWAGWTDHTSNIAVSDELGHFSDPSTNRQPCFPANPVSGPLIAGCIGRDRALAGFSYKEDWPDGSALRATPFTFSSPESLTPGHGTPPFTHVQFETNLAAIEPDCDLFTGEGCTVMPTGAEFYPWPHTVRVGRGCQWMIGDDYPTQLSNFGGETSWGELEFVFAQGVTSAVNFASGVLPSRCL